MVRAGNFVKFVADKRRARSLLLDVQDASRGQVGIVHEVQPRLFLSDILSVYVLATGRVVECYPSDVVVVESPAGVSVR